MVAKYTPEQFERKRRQFYINLVGQDRPLGHDEEELATSYYDTESGNLMNSFEYVKNIYDGLMSGKNNQHDLHNQVVALSGVSSDLTNLDDIMRDEFSPHGLDYSILAKGKTDGQVKQELKKISLKIAQKAFKELPETGDVDIFLSEIPNFLKHAGLKKDSNSPLTEEDYSALTGISDHKLAKKAFDEALIAGYKIDAVQEYQKILKNQKEDVWVSPIAGEIVINALEKTGMSLAELNPNDTPEHTKANMLNYIYKYDSVDDNLAQRLEKISLQPNISSVLFEKKRENGVPDYADLVKQAAELPLEHNYFTLPLNNPKGKGAICTP